MIIRTDTDAQGRYRLRVAPGESYIYLTYMGAPEGVTITLKKGETKTLPLQMDGNILKKFQQP